MQTFKTRANVRNKNGMAALNVRDSDIKIQKDRKINYYINHWCMLLSYVRSITADWPILCLGLAF